jgi:phosphodiesterase/alkaline phosphatase D-like protein
MLTGKPPIRSSLRFESKRRIVPVSRRRFVASVAAGVVAAPAILKGLRADASERNGSLFTLGVASGEPDHESVVLWTRLAPEPLSGGAAAAVRRTHEHPAQQPRRADR